MEETVEKDGKQVTRARKKVQHLYVDMITDEFWTEHGILKHS